LIVFVVGCLRQESLDESLAILFGIGFEWFLVLAFFPLLRSGLLLHLLEVLLLFGVDGVDDGPSPLSLGIWIEPDEEAQIRQSVLPARKTPGGCFPRSKMRLDILRTDESSQIGVGHRNVWKSVTNLEGRTLFVCAVKIIEFLEGRLGPDDESTKMSSRCKLEKVEACNTAELNTGNVSESLEKRSFLIVNNQRTTSLDVTSVPQFTFTSSNLLRSDNLLDVGESVDVLEEGDGRLGLLNIDDGFVGNDQRNL